MPTFACQNLALNVHQCAQPILQSWPQDDLELNLSFLVSFLSAKINPEGQGACYEIVCLIKVSYTCNVSRPWLPKQELNTHPATAEHLHFLCIIIYKVP